MSETGGGPHPREGWGIQDYEIEIQRLTTKNADLWEQIKLERELKNWHAGAAEQLTIEVNALRKSNNRLHINGTRDSLMFDELRGQLEIAYSEISFAVHDLAAERSQNYEMRSKRLAESADEIRAFLDGK